ncbi:hypothetical protein [Devosia sp.]|uniref:hypothetical protein n=1 Tax=Devosia sp. TaxID=1871048 RepID=UPI001A04B790|nr:hypothetical protein [Devosia sp.]MBE0579675.1 hypothetical protein [Devosia sp.]
MFVFLAQLPTQLVEFRRLRKILNDRGVAHKLLVESAALLSEPGSEMLPTLAPEAADGVGTVTLNKEVHGVTAVVTAARAARRSARQYLRSIAATALVVGEDGVGGNLPWIAEARRIGLPVYILPYEFSGRRQAEVVIGSAPEDYVASGRVARLFSLVKPQWSGIVGGRRVFRLPLRFALGYEIAGVAPPNPWAVHGGRASRLLAESPRMAAHYASDGIGRPKVVVVGSLALDDVHTSMAMKPRSQKMCIVCALPPDYTDTYGPRPYAEAMASWVDQVRRLGDVVIQAHPAARAKLEGLGFAIDQTDIATLIGKCDVLVTSVSSIIRLALAAGKPVVNYDLYRFGYDDYADAKGVITTSDQADFNRAINDLAKSDELSELQRRAESDRARWGAVDGLAHTRIMSALGLASGETR